MDNRLRGKTALVTGASSGIGADLARELATRGSDLVLVARREDRLLALKAEVEASENVEVRTVRLDLTGEGSVNDLHQTLADEGTGIDILVNNAGLGLHGYFVETEWETERKMLELDIMVLTHLTKLFVRDMVARRFGYVLHLSSIGAYQPSPTYATYSAAKAYVLSFGEALNYELRGTGVSCTVLSPGIVGTEFLQVAGQRPTMYQRLFRMESGPVAQAGIEAMLKGKSSIVPGWPNALLAQGTRFVPRRLSTAIAHRMMTLG